MNKINCVFLIIIFVFFSLIYPDVPLIILPEVINPTGLIVTKTYIYVIEKYKINIYNRQNYKFIKSFGKKGQGPEEFPYRIRVFYYNKKLIVNAHYKVLWFTEEGNYIKEKKNKRGTLKLVPIKNGYIIATIGFHRNGSVSNKLGIYDNDIILKKTLYDKKNKSINKSNIFKLANMGGQVSFVADTVNIIIADSKNKPIIKIFDHNGALINKIVHNYSKDIITDSFKKIFIENRIQNTSNKFMKEYLKKTKNSFPKYFPPFAHVFTTTKMIYVFRFKADFYKYEVLVMTKQGKVITKTTVNKVKQYYIENGIYYYLLENEEEETWKLCSQRLL